MNQTDLSVLASLDAQSTHLLEFIPYLLQDLWELGTPVQLVLDKVLRYVPHNPDVQILDLGCGKGALLVQLAAAYRYRGLGIDGFEAFINTALQKADEFGVSDLCTFYKADIRQEILALKGFQCIILGAIGPVLGNYHKTLCQLATSLTADGVVIINDAYETKKSLENLPTIFQYEEILSQTRAAGFELIDETVIPQTIMQMKNIENTALISKRCSELKLTYPEKSLLFEQYIQSQTAASQLIDQSLTCSVMVFRRVSAERT